MNRFVCGLVVFSFTAILSAEPEIPDAAPSWKMLRQSFGDADETAFLNPPQVFRPEIWMHFIGGNVSTQGITADLEAIKGAGISGIQLFHEQMGEAWPGVEPQIKCLSERWDSVIQHTAGECRRLGLRFTMQNCPGWAMSGGPWIKPDNAMRHLIWSRTDIVGGSNVMASLPMPQPSKEEWRDYREVAVLAFPTPEDDTGNALVPVSIKSNREKLPWGKCIRNEKGAMIIMEPGSEPAWLETTFKEPVTLRTVQLSSVQGFNHGWCYNPGVTITVQAVLPDGLREVARYEMPQSNWQDNKPISLACSDLPASTYRITIDNKHSMKLTSIQLFTGARKNNWESEAAWVLRGLIRMPHPRQATATWIDPSRIINLTGKMDAQGNFAWDAPAGSWTVLRWGNVNTGKKNAPAPPEATGWECDKLSPTGAEKHFAGYIGRLSSKKGPAGNGLLKGLLIDSWECETQTWTPGMDSKFAGMNNYELLPWFPALAGYVVGDPETTTQFLRDWRATINDLLVQNFFGQITSLAHKQKLSITYETACGDVFPADILEYFKYADVPMCEFWHPRSEAFVGSLNFKPVKPCASAARLYGKPRIAAEAFTSFELTWNEHPGMLKNIANIHFAEGVTHFILQAFTHNPRIDSLPPGTSFGSRIGTPFLSRQTWWKNMPEFTDYLSRCGYLLERGRPVSDVLWYLGDEVDHKPDQNAPFPTSYHYDYCNPDILLNRLSVRNGRIVTPEGLSYSMLWLPNCQRMLPETTEKLLSLVRKGATVVGDRPSGMASLRGGTKAEERFRKALTVLWGQPGEPGERIIGKGRLISGLPLEEVLSKVGLERDMKGEGVSWLHRQIDNADWYFVAAPEQQGFKGTLGFRASGFVELWDPLTGQIKSAGEVRHEGAHSLVTLELPPSGSLFVVFRKTDKKTVQPAVAAATLEQHVTVNGPWTLSFPSGWDAPGILRTDELKSWTKLDLPPAARAFSGTTVYSTEFTLKPFITNTCIELDLGRVEVIASVCVNGNPAGVVWAPPFKVDITRFVKIGLNHLTVDVTSTWYNRLAYDAGLPEKERKTWTIAGPAKGSKLIETGLLGPVVVSVKGK